MITRSSIDQSNQLCFVWKFRQLIMIFTVERVYEKSRERLRYEHEIMVSRVSAKVYGKGFR